MNYYTITKHHVKAINVLIRTLQEAINREAFSKEEVDNIIKTIEYLNQDP